MGDHGDTWYAIQGIAMKGAYGVSIFFVLSGTLLSYPFWTAYLNGEKLPSLRHYAKRRAARIVPGFYVALTASFLVVLAWYAGHAASAGSVPRGAQLSERLALADVLPLGGQWAAVVHFARGDELHLHADRDAWAVPPDAASGGSAHWAPVLGGGAAVVVFLLNEWIIRTFIPTDEGKGWQFGAVGGAKEWMPFLQPRWLLCALHVRHFCGGVHCVDARARSRQGDGPLTSPGLAACWDRGAGVGHPEPLEPTLTWASRTSRTCGHGSRRARRSLWLGASHSKWLGRIMDNRFARYTATVSFGIYVWHYLMVVLVEVLTNGEFTYGNVHDLGRFAIMSGMVLVLSYAIASASWFWLEKTILESRWARR